MIERAGARTHDRPLRKRAVLALCALLAVLCAASPLLLAVPSDPAAARTDLGPLPVARSDSYTVSQDTTRYVRAPGVLSNDSKRRPLNARFVLGVEYGHLELRPGGAFVYTTDANFRGTDYFKYRAC